MSKKLRYYFIAMLAWTITPCFAEKLVIVDPITDQAYAVAAKQPKLIGADRFSENLLKLRKERYVIKTQKSETNIKPTQIFSHPSKESDSSYFIETLSPIIKNSAYLLEGSFHTRPSYVVPYYSLKITPTGPSVGKVDAESYGLVFGNIPNMPLHIVLGKFAIPFGSGASESIESNLLENFGWAANLRAGSVNFGLALHDNFSIRASLFSLFDAPQKQIAPTKDLSTPDKSLPWGSNLQFDWEKFSNKMTFGLSYITDNPSLANTDYPIKEACNVYLQGTWGPIKLQGELMSAFETGLFRQSGQWFPENVQGTNTELSIDLLGLCHQLKLDLLQLPCKVATGLSQFNTERNIFLSCTFDKIGYYTQGFIDSTTISHKWRIDQKHNTHDQNTTIQFVHDFMKT